MRVLVKESVPKAGNLSR